MGIRVIRPILTGCLYGVLVGVVLGGAFGHMFIRPLRQFAHNLCKEVERLECIGRVMV